jgi:hypothetical protein
MTDGCNTVQMRITRIECLPPDSSLYYTRDVKIRRLLVYLVLMAITFVTGASVDDYYAQRRFSENVKKIEIGMSENEVTDLLGKPTSRTISDIEGEYLCFSGGSFHFNPSTKCVLMLQMNRQGRVVTGFPKEYFRHRADNE